MNKTTDQLNADTLFAFQMAMNGHEQFEWRDNEGDWNRNTYVISSTPHRIYHDLPSPEWTRSYGDWKGDKDAVIEEVMFCNGTISPHKGERVRFWSRNFSNEPQWRIYAYKLAKATVSIPDGFTKWHGGECPVADGVRIDVAFADGSIEPNTDNAWNWTHTLNERNIIAYRVIEKKVVPWTLQTIPSPLPELVHKASGEICTIAVVKLEGVMVSARGYYDYEQILNHFTQRASGSVCGTEEV